MCSFLIWSLGRAGAASASVARVHVIAGSPYCCGNRWAARFAWGDGTGPAIVTSGLILVAAFCWDWRTLAGGGLPGTFPWPLFLAGEGLACGAVSCLRAEPHGSSPWPEGCQPGIEGLFVAVRADG